MKPSRTLPALLVLVLATTARAAEPPVSIDVKREGQAASQITFKAGDAVVSTYHVGPQVAKPYFWPLRLGTTDLTRAWPMVKGQPGETTDHVHQKSAWFCHGDVIPEGVELK